MTDPALPDPDLAANPTQKEWKKATRAEIEAELTTLRAASAIRDRERAAMMALMFAARSGDPNGAISSALAGICRALGWGYAAVYTMGDDGSPVGPVGEAAVGDGTGAYHSRAGRQRVAAELATFAWDVGLGGRDGTTSLDLDWCAVPVGTKRNVRGVLWLAEPAADAIRNRSTLEGLGLALGLIVESETAQGRLAAEEAERRRWWQMFYRGTLALTQENDIDNLFGRIVRLSMSMLRADTASLMLEDAGEMLVRVVLTDDGTDLGIEGYRFQPGVGLGGRVMATGSAMSVENYLDWPGRDAFMASSGVRPAAAAPLLADRRPVGVLVIARRKQTTLFTEEDLDKLKFVAQAAVLVLQRANAARQAETLALVEERNRLARDLHDGLAQDLAAIMLRADYCQSLVPEGQTELADSLETVSTALQRTIRSARATILALRDRDDLAESGSVDVLEDALRGQIDRIRAQTGIVSQLVVKGSYQGEIAPKTAYRVLAVLKEALNNVMRHAEAGNIVVTLDWRVAGFVAVTIEDDGLGFDPTTFATRGERGTLHFGLVTLREIVNQTGGMLSVRSAPGKGTIVEAIVPLAKGGTGEGSRGDSRTPG